MLSFIRANSDWLIPIIVAVIAGIFGLFAFSGSKNRQKIKNIKNSTINLNNEQGNKRGR